MNDLALRLVDLASLSILCGTWLKLTIDALQIRPWTWSQAIAIAALVLMSTSATTMLVDSYTGAYHPHADDRWMHAALGLWNALILLNVIRGTSYSIRRPEPRAKLLTP